MIRRDPQTMLPLTHLSYHIMLAVADHDLHGYAIIKNVRDRSQRTINPGTGTFYSAIKRMLDEGLLEDAAEPEGSRSHDSRRKFYGLTTFGRNVLLAETQRLEELLNAARSIHSKATSA